jgi:hypothetical protein
LGIFTALIVLTPVEADIVDRRREPVIVKLSVANLPRWVEQGHATDSFELWKYTYSGWQIAPFQIDEFIDTVPLSVRPFFEDSQYADRRVCNGSTPSPPPEGPGPCEFLYDLRGENPPSGVLSDTDELVFMAGSTGRCDAPMSSWPSASAHEGHRQKILVRDNAPGGTEEGCLYLFRRTSGVGPAPPDLIDYQPAGDGVPSECVPHADACGTIVGSAFDYDGDGSDDIPSYRMDYLGNWAMDRLEIGTTQGSPADDLLDINKFRIMNPGETERAWDLSEPAQGSLEIFGCAVFSGYIDGPVRIVRTVQGAVSGVTTRKIEFIYPGEYTGLVYLRLHQVGGNIWQGLDLDESVVSPTGDPAIIYNAENNGSQFYDEVDGTVSGSIEMPVPLDWYQMSSSKGSFLIFHNDEQAGRLVRNGLGDPDYQGNYEDSSVRSWSLPFPAEYDEEIGERGIYRTELPGVTGGLIGSQNIETCENPLGDGITIITGKTFLMLDGGKAAGDAGALEIARRARGVMSQTIVEERRNGSGRPGTPCVPVLSISYGNDGGVADINISGCGLASGWNLYQEQGGGVRRRLATLAPGATWRETTLSLNERRSYTATVTDLAGNEGEHSQVLTLLHDDTLAPEPPETISATVSTNGFKIAWSVPSSTDVAGYRVLVSDTSGGPYIQAHNSLLSAMHQDLEVRAIGGTTSYVVVQAVDYAGNESLPSMELRVPLKKARRKSNHGREFGLR